MKRVLIIVERVAPLGFGNGKEHINLTLISTYAKLGFDVSVIVTNQDNGKVKSTVNQVGALLLTKSQSNKIPRLSLKLKLSLFHTSNRNNVAKWLNSAILDSQKKGSYDIVISSLYSSDVPAWIASSLRYVEATKKVILWEHRSHYAAQSNFSRLPFMVFIIRSWIYSFADIIAVVSHPTAEFMKDRIRLNNTQVLIIPNPVKDEFFKISNKNFYKDKKNRNYCISTQNFSRPLKGGSILIKAMEIIKKTREDISLLMVGKHSPSLVSKIKDTKLEHMISCIDRVPHDEIPKLVANSRLAVISSYIETFSNPAAEALSAGVPVVSTICGGPEDFIEDSKHGKLVPSGDPEKLAEAIIEIWDTFDQFSSHELSNYAKNRFGSDVWPDYWKNCNESLLKN